MATAFNSTAGLQAPRGLPLRTPLRVSRLNAQRSAGPTLQEQAVGAVIGGLMGCSLALSLPDVISPPVAHAGVILQQPERKKIFIEPTPEKKSAEKKTAEKKSSGGEGLNLPSFGSAGTLALPLSVAGIAGLTVVARKVDGGFDEFMNGALVKDANVDGVGYEVALKSGEPLKAVGGKKKK